MAHPKGWSPRNHRSNKTKLVVRVEGLGFRFWGQDFGGVQNQRVGALFVLFFGAGLEL